MANSNSSNYDFPCYNPPKFEIIFSPFAQVCLILIYSCTAVFALLGNVCVILVQLKCAESHSMHSMRKYLINLALSDIAIGMLCLPFVYTDFVVGEWTFPHCFCPSMQYVLILSVFVTSNTLMMIGIERYFAILYPFSRFYRQLRANSNKVILSIWLVGSLYAFFPTKETGVEHLSDLTDINHHTYYRCNIGLNPLNRRLYLTANFVFTFAIPMCVLIFVYASIMLKIKYRSNNNFDVLYCANTQSVSLNQSSTLTEPKSVSAERMSYVTSTNSRQPDKTLHLTLIIVLVYGLCWMPYKMFQLFVEFEWMPICTEKHFYSQLYLYVIFHWLAMASTFANPIVYTFLSKQFQSDLHNIHLAVVSFYCHLNQATTQTARI